MLVLTEKGLYCPAGNFYIDPKRAVEHAVITHAHSDHARRGSKQYYCVDSGTGILRARLGNKIAVESCAFGAIFFLNDVKISFHPAGHILGSSQIRIEYLDEVWVVSGDYKRDADPTCEPFESVTCDVFITEATFGTPAYRWNKDAELGKDILQWWNSNASVGINSVLLAYSLGKTQRILGELAALSDKPVYCSPHSSEINSCYRAQGIHLSPTICLSQVSEVLQGELFVVPFSFLKSDKAYLMGPRYQTAFASGWVNTRARHFNRGFLMSDHADWDDLLLSIKESCAKRVYVQHRGQGALVRHLRSLGIKAYPDTHLVPKIPNQLMLF
jgi:putative mRNA 3-end processing factor